MSPEVVMSALSPERLAELFALPEDERLALADALVESTNGDVPADVVAESERRLRSLEADPSRAIPAAVVLDRLRKVVGE